MIEVTCITHRKNAIYHGVGVGQADHLVLLGNFTMEARIYTHVKSVVPELLNVYVPISGRRNLVYLQVKKTRPGIGKEAIMATLPTDARIKYVIVVDEDVDLFNESEVLWSIAYRTDWDKDLVIVKGAAAYPCDPTLPADLVVGTRGGIDATLPPPIEPGLPRYYQMPNVHQFEGNLEGRLEANEKDKPFCPIDVLEHKLRIKQILKKDIEEKIRSEELDLVQKAVQCALSSPEPDIKEAYTDVFGGAF